jgi:hypothetical protein
MRKICDSTVPVHRVSIYLPTPTLVCVLACNLKVALVAAVYGLVKRWVGHGQEGVDLAGLYLNNLNWAME